jgi:hypothetical protein
MPELVYYLIVYDARSERLVELREYRRPNEAEDAFSQAERVNRNTGMQVVMLSAGSLDTVKETHPHYFRENGGGDTVDFLAPSPAGT